ncbi:hypothetical protein CHU95_18650 [Niveispirillum lacus]|uniref:DUF481 domain-containing protein n=1 Tax=Niveispirillum lacus TaxID=1981099 RepID=A0A255YU87_9PROT|nr:DUF481 domain-containing protein [Niveispirillum lacus]OYQ32772.1 hypothetical protein CHU95_18650 [Niveispirillum lacus]
MAIFKTAPLTAALMSCCCAAVPAFAQETGLPAGVAAMLREAAGRDDSALDLAESLALAAFPDQGQAIAALAVRLRKDRKDAEHAVKRAAAAHLFAGWSGDAELGAALSTGNSDDKTLSVRVDLVKETVRWRHQVTAGADVQRADGENSKERFEAGYEVNFFINPRVYTAAELAWERDIFAGYRHRLTETVGAGYVILDADGRRLSVEGGPGARHVFLYDIPGEPATENEVVLRAAADFTQDLSNSAKFAQTVKSLVGAKNTTLEATSTLTARINALFSARVAVTIRHETAPPDDRKSTDTLSRATLVYTF